MCDGCRRELLRPLASKAVRLDTWRTPAKDMVDPQSEARRARAERVRARKDRKRSLRSVTREIGIVGAITMLLRGQDDARARERMRDETEDCQQCLKRQRRAIA
jgi:hypothetical protein